MPADGIWLGVSSGSWQLLAELYTRMQDDGFSMWSRPFKFGNNNIRVEEEWGLGIGSSKSCKQSMQESIENQELHNISS